MACDDHDPAMPHVEQTGLRHDPETGEHIEEYRCEKCETEFSVRTADCGECWRE